jgi:hypothetical protein
MSATMTTALLRRTAVPLWRRTSLQIQQQQQRWMGPAMPKPQSSEAKLWEGHPTHTEGWEFTTYLTYGVSTVLLILSIGFAPETSIKVWASNEAQARLDLQSKSADFTPEFGRHYGTPYEKYDFTSIQAENPFNEGN